MRFLILVFSPNTLNICLGDTVIWYWVNGSHTTTSTAVPSGANSWNTNIDNSNSSFIYIPTVAGNYNYECTPHAMVMMGSFTVTDAPTIPVITSSSPSVFCQGTSNILSVLQNANYTYSWNLNGNLLSNSNVSSYPATLAGAYTAAYSNMCGTTFSSPINLTTIAAPTVSLTATNTTICLNGCDTLTVNSPTAQTFIWSTLSGMVTAGKMAIYCPPMGTSLNSKVVYVTATDSNTHCSKTDSQIINLISSPLANFTFTNTGLTYTFTASPAGANQYIWDFGDGTNKIINTTSGIQTHTFTTINSFPIQLKVVMQGGCMDSIVKVITPNAITNLNTLNGVYLTPIPTKDNLILHGIAEASIQIIDLTGRVLINDIKTNNNLDYLIDVSQLIAGTYIIKVKTNYGSAIQKFIIEK